MTINRFWFRISENPLGFSTLDLGKFKKTFLSNFDVEKIKDMMLKGKVVDLGTRTFCWRLLLGVIPEENSPSKWVDCIRKERQDFYRKTEEQKINKSKDLDPKFFNPLAVSDNNPWNNHFKDKDVRDLLIQDIERTS